MKNEPIQNIEINNTRFFLLKYNEGYLLIDAGWADKFKQFKKALCCLNIDIRSIKFILITHHHHDHAALVYEIRKESDCRIIIHKDEVEFIEKGTTYTKETHQYNTWLKMLDKCMSPFIQYKYKPILLDKDDIIVADDDFDIYGHTGIEGKIIHTPGHSKGSLSLVLNNGNAFVGDVAMNILKIFGQDYRPIEAENYGEVYKSWKKLMACGAKRLYPSHGSDFPVQELQKILNCI